VDEVRKKLIEVALPLAAINAASAREKSMRHGHPSMLHLWWARRPLAACRAVLFASLVDDPSSRTDVYPSQEAQDTERRRLFGIIERLVQWENSTDARVLSEARDEIRKSIAGPLPMVFDPFCGGGSIPLEAQRLGLESRGSDLNPVAVLISKALIEIPSRFAGDPPMNPDGFGLAFKRTPSEVGASGLASDVRYYGQWLRDEAERRIGRLYSTISLPASEGGGTATVIAWLWSRTVKCPNPSCAAQMPLVKSYWLSSKRGKRAWLRPEVDRASCVVKFAVARGDASSDEIKVIGAGTGFVDGKGKKVKASFRCIFCGAGPVKGEYIDHVANGVGFGVIPLAIVADGSSGRAFVEFPRSDGEAIEAKAQKELSNGELSALLPGEPAKGTFGSNAQGRVYGFTKFSDYFTKRQLVLLTSFVHLVQEVRAKVVSDASRTPNNIDAKWRADPQAYADAIATYLAFIVDQMVNHHSSLCGWNAVNAQMRNVFSRHAISIAWDYAEANPFGGSSGSFFSLFERMIKGFAALPTSPSGVVEQADAAVGSVDRVRAVVSTDPPYYGNISYSDLSDFFYVWLRRSVGSTYPGLFTTVLTPKEAELTATPHRFPGDRMLAKRSFEGRLSKTFVELRRIQRSEFPLAVYYAFKQSEGEEDDAGEVDPDDGDDSDGASGAASTGWETMLEALLSAGFSINGTWPLRTEKPGRSVEVGTNALASSIVLVCRPRAHDAPACARRDMLTALRRELPESLHDLQFGNIAPVDLAQAAIGPGMAVFSRYSRVLEADGTPMRVRTALVLINQILDEVLSEQDSEHDPDTRWAITWFEQHGVDEGPYGDAETLARAKDTAVAGLVEAGILHAKAGKVRLLKRDELLADWDRATDKRLTVWETVQYLIRRLEKEGEPKAAELLAKLGSKADSVRDLAYRLYTTCERKKWNTEALSYNALVVAWPEIARLAASAPQGPAQQTLPT
jgi:putative DNA methylase